MELEVDRLKVELGEAKESTKSISDQLAKSEAMVSESKDQIAALQAELHAKKQSSEAENLTSSIKSLREACNSKV